MKNSMDWILEEVLEELKTLKGMTENRIHEYWRGRML